MISFDSLGLKPELLRAVAAEGYTEPTPVQAEAIPAVRSAAMTLLVPAGASSDPVGKTGTAAVISEWALRGAGDRDSRALTGYLDGLGVQRSSQAGSMKS